MASPVNIYEYICDVQSCNDSKIQCETPDMTEEEMFDAMDRIIEMKYPDDHTYDVSDSEEQIPLKKQKVCLEEKDFVEQSIENSHSNVKIKNKVNENEQKSEKDMVEMKVRSKIAEVFRQMKLKEVVENC